MLRPSLMWVPMVFSHVKWKPHSLAVVIKSHSVTETRNTDALQHSDSLITHVSKTVETEVAPQQF